MRPTACPEPSAQRDSAASRRAALSACGTAGARTMGLLGLVGLAALVGCPPIEDEPVPDLAVPADLAVRPDLRVDAAMPPDLAEPYVQQPGCSKDAWCWVTPRPQGNTLLAIWGSGTGEVWAGGYGGALVRGGGAAWQPVLSPTRATIRALWGSGANYVVLAGDSATALRWDGASWESLPVPASPPRRITTLYGVFGTSPSDLWLVGAGGVALHYDGTAMVQVPTPDLGEVRAVWGPSAASTYAVSSLGTEIQVLHYDAAAKAFVSVRTLPSPATPTALWGTSDDSFFVSTSTGEIYHLSKTGAVLANPKSNYGINALWGSGAAVYAVGDVQYRSVVPPDITARKGSLLQLGGTAFAEVAGAPAAGFFALWGTGPSDLYFVGTAGTIAHYDGSKFTTTSLYEPLTGVGAPLTGLGSAAGDLVAVGDFGATLRLSGATWTSQADDVHRRYRGLSGSADRMFAIVQDLRLTTGSEIARYTGSAFAAETVPPKSDLRGLFSGAAGPAVAVGAGDLVLQRSGAGVWTPALVESPGTTVLRAAYAVSPSHIWAVGGGDTFDSVATNPTRILLSDGTRYRSVAAPVSEVILRGVWAASATDAWAVGDAGTALHWNGSSWQAVALTTLANLYAVWGRDASTVYAVGTAGTLLHYDGHDWKQEDTGTQNTLVQVWGTGTEVYALGGSGTILRKSLR